MSDRRHSHVPSLEVLEDRMMPSRSSLLPLSPPVKSPPIQDISVTKTLDATSALLQKVAPAGQPQTPDLKANPAGTSYYQIELENVMITSYQSGGGGDSRPMESLSINYSVQYRESDYNFASRLMEEEGIFYYF